MIKKIGSIALALTVTVWLSGAAMALPTVQAQTVSDLQAQIAALLAQIQQLQAQLNNQTGGSGSSVSCFFTKSLTIGSTGEDVKCLQQYLNSAGYTVAASGVGSPGNETMYFGALTQAAVAKWQAANGVSPAVGYFGPISQAKYNALMAAAGGSTGGGSTGDDDDDDDSSIPDEGVEVSVKSAKNVTVPKGANNVELMQVTFTAGEDVEIDDLTFNRTGAGARGDWSKIYLYEGNTLLASGRSVNTSHEVTFSNLNLEIDKGDSMTITVTGTLSATAGSGNVHTFKLAKVIADADVDGLPVEGRQITIANTSAGSLTVDLQIPSQASAQLGDEEVEIASVDITADSEDVDLNRIILTQYGSVNISALDDIEVEIDAEEVDVDVTINGDELTIVFDDPYLIEDGNEVSLKVYATITAGAYIKGGTGDIQIGVDDTSHVYGVGRDYGFGTSVTLTTSGNPGDTYDIDIEAAEVTLSYNGPEVDDIGLGNKGVVLFDFDMTVTADYEIENISFKFDLGAGSVLELKNLKLVNVTDGNKVVAGPDEQSATSTSFYHTFNDAFILETGTHQLRLVADIGTNSTPASEVTVSLIVDDNGDGTVDALDLDAENLDTSEALDIASSVVPAGTLGGKQQTITKPNLDIVVASQPVAQNYVVGKKDTILGAFTFDANNVSDINVRSLTFDIQLSTSTDDNPANHLVAPQNLVGSLTLKTSDGTVIDSKSVGSGTAPTVTYNTSGKLDIEAGKEVTVQLIGDIKTSYSVESTSDEVRVRMTAITAKDSENNNPNFNSGSFSTVNGIIFDIYSAGSFDVVEFAASNPSQDGIIVPTDGVVFSAYTLRPLNEDLRLRKLVVDTAKGGDTDNYTYYKNVQVWVDGVKKATKTISSSTATFNDININLDKDEDTVIELRADLVSNGFGTSLTSGEELSLYLSTTASDYTIVGLASGTSVAMSTDSLEDSIRMFQIAKSYPTFSYSGSNGTIAPSGTQKLFEYTVHANSNGSVRVRKVSFDVTVSEASTANNFQVTSWQLRNQAGNIVATDSTAVGDDLATLSETAEITFNATSTDASHYEIEAGQSKTFSVWGAVTGGINDNANVIQVSFSDDDASDIYRTDASLDVNAGNVTTGIADIIWNDTRAEFNGYYLDLPVDIQASSVVQ